MGCQTRVTIGEFLTFSICTHDPDTGELTDTDFVPIYRIYEDEVAVPILTGVMAKLDGAVTRGFYTEQIDCSTANSFEDGKSYTIYIEATVDTRTGGISFAFVAESIIVILEILLSGEFDIARGLSGIFDVAKGLSGVFDTTEGLGGEFDTTKGLRGEFDTDRDLEGEV